MTVHSSLDKDVDDLRELLRRAGSIVNRWPVDGSAAIVFDENAAIADNDGRSQISEESFELVEDDADD